MTLAAQSTSPATTGPNSNAANVSEGRQLFHIISNAPAWRCLALIVEEVIDALGQFLVDAVDAFQFRQRRARDAAR